MDRGSFITATGASALAASPLTNALARASHAQTASGSGRISELKRNTAIAMWDFSWLHRHHPAGSFEDWDRVLDGLVDRGYNAIRMDAFPALVAADSEGGALLAGPVQERDDRNARIAHAAPTHGACARLRATMR